MIRIECDDCLFSGNQIIHKIMASLSCGLHHPKSNGVYTITCFLMFYKCHITSYIIYFSIKLN